MGLDDFKSVIYFKASSQKRGNYEKVYIYDSVKKKLRKVLRAIPKNKVRGFMTLYKFDKNMNLKDSAKMENYQSLDEIRTIYRKFVGDFSMHYYVYYINTYNGELQKHYDVVFILLPKKSKYSNISEILSKTSISDTNNIIDKINERIKELKLE